MPISIGCIYAIREEFSDIPIIGIGGIESAEDIIEFVQAGANAVGIGTHIGEKTTKDLGMFLSNLTMRLEYILQERGMKSLREMWGVAHHA